MNRKKFGFGAFASAVTLLAALFGAESAASAQDQAFQPSAAAVGAAPDPAPPISFVAQEVVQPLEAAASTQVPSSISDGVDSLRQLVGDMPIEIELNADMQCLAQAIYFEARGEPLAGQLAVARVIINRATSGLYPASYCDVVKQPAQFSFVKRGRIPQVDESSAAWDRAKALAQIAHEDLWKSEAGDALYFHAKYVRPSWARQKVARATIDTHIFYR
jgi:spore germination cell wall hydrolase CwlJ-like protein